MPPVNSEMPATAKTLIALARAVLPAAAAIAQGAAAFRRSAVPAAWRIPGCRLLAALALGASLLGSSGASFEIGRAHV